MPTRRGWAAIGTIGVPYSVLLFLAVIPALGVLGNHFPSPIAVHWGISGEPDGSMKLMPGLLLAVWAWMALMGFVLPRRDRDAPALVWLYFAAGVLIAVQSSLVIANWDATTWRQADRLPLPVGLTTVLGSGAAFAALGRFLEARISSGASSSAPLEHSVGLREHERAAWIGEASNRASMVMIAFGGIALIAIILWPIVFLPSPYLLHWWRVLLNLALVICLVAFTLLFTSISATVSSNTVTLRFGPWRWPSRSYALEAISQAGVTEIDPMRYGGWGYRMCGRRCRAFVIRRGEALELQLNDGRRRVITIDGADQGAGLINDLIAQEQTVKGS